MPRHQPEGYVYAIRTEDSTRVKIGFTCTATPSNRLAALQRATKQRLVLVHAIRVPTPFAVEGLLHDLLAPFRLDGEWFTLDKQILTIFPDLVFYVRHMVRLAGHVASDEEGVNVW